MTFLSAQEYWYLLLASIHFMPIRWIGLTLRYSRIGDPTRLVLNSSNAMDEISVALVSKPLRPLLFFLEYQMQFKDWNPAQHFVFFKGIYSF